MKSSMNLRTWFSGVLETRTALHIGTGTILSTATDAPILRGADGLPLIPEAASKAPFAPRRSAFYALSGSGPASSLVTRRQATRRSRA